MTPSGARRFPRGEFVVVRDGSATPQMSILMPVFRQERFVAEAVAAVLDQRGVTAEVIISDDDSGDGTFERALAMVEARADTLPVDHRIIMRRAGRRLGRDHVHHLADHAACDVVMAAHGDDIARPDRATRLLAAMRSTGAAMAASTCDTIDASGRLIRAGTASTEAEHLLELEEVLQGQPWLIGATQAWRRSALALFGPVTTPVTPVGQDRVMAARAWWAGGVVAVDEPLLQRRVHDDSWHLSAVDTRRPDASAFGLSLTRVCMADAMLDDVEFARARGLATDEEAALARTRLTAKRQEAGRALRDAYGSLGSEGLTPLWVGERERRLAADGALAGALLRRARLLAPVRFAVDTARRARGA